jgi:hypothetical protein
MDQVIQHSFFTSLRLLADPSGSGGVEAIALFCAAPKMKSDELRVP